MDISYLQSCPTCDAPIEMDEADRVVTCEYCDGKNYMIQDRPLRFVLPHLIPREIHDDDIFNIPYLRFKGYIFSCQGQEIRHKIVDTTHIGLLGEELPPSMGLRPQAMQMKLLSLNTIGRYVKLTAEVKEIFAKAARLTDVSFANSGDLYHRSFVGETISFIYLPVYYRDDTLYDGVLNRQFSREPRRDQIEKNTIRFKAEWRPRFISTNCPNCAALLSGERDSLVMVCRNCAKLWIEAKGRFIQVSWSSVSGAEDSYSLPFWVIHCQIDGIALSSLADFFRLTNQPFLVQPQHEEKQMHFYVPAFKIHPQNFLRIAQKLTLSQALFPEGQKSVPRRFHPVTLPLTEAHQAIKSILSKSVVNKKKFLPLLPQLKVSPSKARLIYLAFSGNGYDYVQEQTRVAINKNILRFGRSM